MLKWSYLEEFKSAETRDFFCNVIEHIALYFDQVNIVLMFK